MCLTVHVRQRRDRRVATYRSDGWCWARSKNVMFISSRY
ncbi:hypothetical protein AKJ09_06753 [Labilithrix luteola]|uniref:Uncharacterized protein n=1 Tax=Labilithrix luteola TaxID=1391654 RepID=A0A0K1Q3X5_9BACT|nr:hypothetical protein AKJ09_06753 [Labilithrix luteola]